MDDDDEDDSRPGELEHVIRPTVPWRREQRTECGKDPTTRRAITRDAFTAKVRKQGQERSALTTCMTCWHTATRWPTWDENPVATIGRETHTRRNPQFEAELRAIAALIAAHRDEFDGYLAGLKEAPSLAARRQRRAAR